MSDLTKLPKQVMIDLINTDNGSSLTDTLLDFGLPTAATGQSPARNTELTVSAKAGSGYTGSVVVTYNRLGLTTDILTPSGKDATFIAGDALKIKDIIPELNALLNINLTDDDYIDGDLPTFVGGIPNETLDVVVVANANSLCYTGSLTFHLKSDEIELSSVITITQLNGLTYVPPVA